MGWILMFVMHFPISLQTVSLGLFASGSSVVALSLESRNGDSLRLYMFCVVLLGSIYRLGIRRR